MAQEFKEKIITVRLRKAFRKPETKRANCALNELKERVVKETRAKEIAVSNGVNELIWSRGRAHTVRKITIKAIQQKDRVFIALPDEKIETKKDEKGKGKKEDKEKEETKEKAQGKEDKKTAETKAQEKPKAAEQQKPAEKKAPIKEEKKQGAKETEKA